MKPERALDIQYDTARWWNSDQGITYAKGYLQSLYSADLHHSNAIERIKAMATVQDSRRLRELSEGLRDQQYMALMGAETYWVSKDMLTYAEQAAEKMQPQPLKAEDLPSTSGFVVFDRPVQFTDARGERVGISAIGWSPATRGDLGGYYVGRRPTGILLSEYSGFHDDEMMESLDQGGRPVDTPLILFGTDPWDYDRDYSDAEGFDFYGDPPDDVKERSFAAMSHIRRLMAAIWALMQQRIARTTVVAPERALRRRLQRAGLLTDAAKEGVRVITLRRESQHTIPQEGDSEGSHYSHRFIVSGHWRNQYYASLGYHRRLWIEAFVKGPEDKPLIPKTNIYALKR